MAFPNAVVFDLDDTLFAHREAVAQGIVEQMRAVGIEPLDRASAVAHWHALEERHYHRYLAGELDYEGQRQARAADFAASHGVSLSAEQASRWFMDYSEHYRSAWLLHDDALGCLAALRTARSGVRIGVITNGDEDFQRRKLDGVGLNEHVDVVVASGSFGVAKPDPRIFLHACELLGVEAPDAAYVGDRLRTDAIGAARAGLTGVWLNRRDEKPDAVDAAEADALHVIELRTLDDLVAALR